MKLTRLLVTGILALTLVSSGLQDHGFYATLSNRDEIQVGEDEEEPP